MKAAVCYFAYNRPEKCAISLEALTECKGIEDTPIVVIQDNYSSELDKEGVEAVKAYIDLFMKRNSSLNIEYCLWKEKAGPYISLTKGFEYTLNRYGRALRVEDDIVVRADYLEYMNEALDFYEDNKNIFCINSFNPVYLYEKEIFLTRHGRSWGMGTWKDRFSHIKRGNIPQIVSHMDGDYLMDVYGDNPKAAYGALLGGNSLLFSEDGEIALHLATTGQYCVCSNTSYCVNIGFDGSGASGLEVDTVNNNYYRRKSKNIYGYDILPECEEKKMIDSIIRYLKKE